MSSAFAEAVQQVTLDGPAAEEAKVRLHFTPGLGIKLMLSCAFGAATLYYLSSGRKESDFGKLLLAGVFGTLTFLVFAF